MCVCQCYYIFQWNIIIDSKCACGFIREDASHLFLNCLLYVEQGTVPFYLLHYHDIRRDIRTLSFEDSQKTWLKIVCIQKQYRHSLRTLSDSLKEHKPYTPPYFTYLPSIHVLYYTCLYTYYSSCSLSDICLYDAGGNFI
jgi:hypothetical protein